MTVTVAVLSATVGVMVIEVTLFATDTVYDVVAAAKLGLSVPLLSINADRLALVETKLAVTVQSAVTDPVV